MYAIGCDVGSQSLKGILLDPVRPRRRPSRGGLRRRLPAPRLGPAGLARLADGPRRGRRRRCSRRPRRRPSSRCPRARVPGRWPRRGRRGCRAAASRDHLARSPGDRPGATPARRRRAPTRSAGSPASTSTPRTWPRRSSGFADAHPQVFERAAGLLLPGSALVAWLTGRARARSRQRDVHAALRRDDPGLVAAHARGHRRSTRPCSAPSPAAEVVVGTSGPAPPAIDRPHDGDPGGRRDRGRARGIARGGRDPAGHRHRHRRDRRARLRRRDRTPIIDDIGTRRDARPCRSPGLARREPRLRLGRQRELVQPRVRRRGHGRDARRRGGGRQTTPGSDGVTFLPTLSGATTPRWNDRARGVFAGLSLNHGRAHLYRALLEGCTFAVRDIVDRLDAMGLGADEIRVVGGGARSRVLVADEGRRDRPTRPGPHGPRSRPRSVPRCWPGVGAGTFADLDDAVARLAVARSQVVCAESGNADPPTTMPTRRYRQAVRCGRARFRAHHHGDRHRGTGMTGIAALPDPTDLDGLRRLLAAGTKVPSASRSASGRPYRPRRRSTRLPDAVAEIRGPGTRRRGRRRNADASGRERPQGDGRGHARARFDTRIVVIRAHSARAARRRGRAGARPTPRSPVRVASCRSARGPSRTSPRMPRTGPATSRSWSSRPPSRSTRSPTTWRSSFATA